MKQEFYVANIMTNGQELQQHDSYQGEENAKQSITFYR